MPCLNRPGACCVSTPRCHMQLTPLTDQPAFGFPHASSSDVLSHASWWVFMAEDIMTFPFVGNIEVMQNWIVDVRTITFSNLWWQASKI